MTRFCFLLFFTLFFTHLSAQRAERFHRVRLDLSQHSIQDLAALGLPVDHGDYEPGRSITTDLSDTEVAVARQAGVNLWVLAEDVQSWYRAGKQLPLPAGQRGSSCGGTSAAGPQYPTPSNYTYGSMGGYQTLDEILAVLDDMRAKFPQLITARAVISDSILTHEGRPIWYVKISKNPELEEEEAEVLYTALHHSREPNGMSQMLFYMWQILENYPSDPQVQYILDHAALYFIPCLNPDGYVFNQTNEPNGGGMWRKNLRDNQDGSFGVDLNRNYGYEWGHDNIGSSPNTGSAVYRGPAGFSEPETRMVRDFCLQRKFRLALNYHTFGNLLIYPWAYSDSPAEEGYRVIGSAVARFNQYLTGTATETVGYQVNGSSDDWMFGGADIYSMTPEVGPGFFGFWPPQDTIDGLNKANAWANRVLAFCALQYAEAEDLDNGEFSLGNPRIPVRLRRLGVEDGPFTLSLVPLTSNIAEVSAPVTLEMPQYAALDTAFTVTFSPGTVSGEIARFLLQVDNGALIFSDTLEKVLRGPSIPLLSDPADDIDTWSYTTGWNVTQENYKTAPSSITDSPNAPYSPNAMSELVSFPVTLPAGAAEISLRFWARWQIEARYDFTVLQAVLPDGSAVNLCGRYTKPGTDNQILGEPVYDGFQEDWVEECIDLTSFAGQTIALRFRMESDPFLEYDGFYMDDLEITYSESGFVHTLQPSVDTWRLLPNRPNPATDRTLIQWVSPPSATGSAELVVLNGVGQVIHREMVRPGQQQIALHTAAWPAGVYTYFLRTAAWTSEVHKMTVVH